MSESAPVRATAVAPVSADLSGKAVDSSKAEAVMTSAARAVTFTSNESVEQSVSYTLAVTTWQSCHTGSAPLSCTMTRRMPRVFVSVVLSGQV